MVHHQPDRRAVHDPGGLRRGGHAHKGSGSANRGAGRAPTKAPEATKAPEPTKAPAATGKTLVIGELTDDSGALAIYGPLFERGFEIGLDYATNSTRTIAGRPIQVVLKDTASNTEKGATLAREAIEKDGAEILLGVPSSPVALAVGGIASQNKKVYIAGPAAADAITGANFNQYVFRCGRQNIQDALTMGAALVKLGQNFVQISQDNAFGQGSAAGFYSIVKAAGGKFTINDTDKGVGTVYVPPETTDFTPYINQILDSKANVLIVTWSGTGFVPMFQQMTQLGVFKQMAVATGMGDNQTLAAGLRQCHQLGRRGRLSLLALRHPGEQVPDRRAHQALQGSAGSVG